MGMWFNRYLWLRDYLARNADILVTHLGRGSCRRVGRL